MKQRALMAPSASAKLPVKSLAEPQSPRESAALNHVCLDQPQAQQAANLIVAVARPDLWRVGAKRMLARLEADARNGPADPDDRLWLPRLKKKYEWMVPLLFADGARCDCHCSEMPRNGVQLDLCAAKPRDIGCTTFRA